MEFEQLKMRKTLLENKTPKILISGTNAKMQILSGDFAYKKCKKATLEIKKTTLFDEKMTRGCCVNGI